MTTTAPRLGEIVAAYSFAADLALGQPMEHALRASILAVQLGRRLGLSKDDLRDVYFLALLRSVGCQAEADLVSRVFGDEQAVNAWLTPSMGGSPRDVLKSVVIRTGKGLPPAKRARAVARTLVGLPGLNAIAPAHCEVASMLAARMGFSTRIQTALHHVYERWDGGGLPRGLARDEIARAARIVAVAHDVDSAAARGGAAAAVRTMKERRGRAHDPEVVDAFLDAPDAIVGVLDVESLWEAAAAAEPATRDAIDDTRVDDALRGLGDVVDLRAAHRRGHSAEVAALVDAVARAQGLGDDEVCTWRRAACVHDVGMCAVPVSIVEKPGKLGDVERERVRLHAYTTERILAKPKGLSSLADLASAAHERLDGDGYHRRPPRSALPLAARVLAAADAWCAMRAARPWRPALDAAQARRALLDDVDASRLDREAATLVLEAAGQPRAPSSSAGDGGLTAREIDVLRLVARGGTNKEVAACLHLAPKTVGNHLQNLYAKIGVTTRAGAAMWAMQHDLLRVE